MYSPFKEKVCEYLDRFLSKKIVLYDSIVITGFWRSGTTWLQKVISIRTKSKEIFEPFYWGVDGFKKLVCKYVSSSELSREFVSSYMPYCEDFSKCGEIKSYFEKAIRGHLKGAWLRRGRTVRNSFSPRTTTKFVRGHLITPALGSFFKPTIIHIRRDPRAVIASLLRENWGAWLREVSIRRLLLEPEDGRAKFFSRWEPAIQRADDSDEFVMRIATYWALTERFIEEQGLENTDGAVVKYEKLVSERPGYLNQKLEKHMSDNIRLSRDNFNDNIITTKDNRKNLTPKKRSKSWKYELKDRQKTIIKKVSKNIGPSNLDL